MTDPTGGNFGMASERESREIAAANASAGTPVVYNWADFFKQAGYAPLTPDWPDDPQTVAGARAEPELLANKTLKQVADHTTAIVNASDTKPVLIGHSTGGLLASPNSPTAATHSPSTTAGTKS